MNITSLLSYNPLSNGITTGVLGDVSFNIVDPAIDVEPLGSVVANAVPLAASGMAMTVAITTIAVIVNAFVFSFIFLLFAVVSCIISGPFILLIRSGVKFHWCIQLWYLPVFFKCMD